MGEPGQLLKCWVILWSLTCLMDVWKPDILWLSPLLRWSSGLAALVSLLWPSMSSFLIAVVLLNSNRIATMPFIWDADQWGLFCDVACVLGFWKSSRQGPFNPERMPEDSAPLIRALLSLFYFAAGFWKLNTSFLNPRLSCGSIFTASLLYQFWPSAILGPPSAFLARGAVQLGPWIAPGECAAGVLLAIGYRSRVANLCGIVSVLLLHLAISYTDEPNAVSNFSYSAATRYFFLLPNSVTAAYCKLTSKPRSKFDGIAHVLHLSVFVTAWYLSKLSGQSGTIFFTMQAVLYTHAIFLEMTTMETHSDQMPESFHYVQLHGSLTKDGDLGGQMRPLRFGMLEKSYLALACFWAFGMQILGLADMCAIASPFSHIRVYGGSNHLILPTGLLLTWAAKAESGLPLGNSLGGGSVRVEYTDSLYLNSLFPGEISEEIRDGVRDLLLEGGHIAREFNPSARRVLGYNISKSMPRWSPEQGPFLRYVIPAMELRRVFVEACEHGESFVLRYVHLPGAGREALRTFGPQVQVIFNASTRQMICELETGVPCAEDELVLLPGLDFPSLKTRIFFPHPLIDGLDSELPCIN